LKTEADLLAGTAFFLEETMYTVELKNPLGALREWLYRTSRYM